jgi:hypothetical protein
MYTADDGQGQGGCAHGHHDAGKHHGMGDRIWHATRGPVSQGYEAQKDATAHNVQGQDLAHDMVMEEQSIQANAE